MLEPELFAQTKAYPKRGGRHVWCKPCSKAYHAEYSKGWEIRNREKRNARCKTDSYRKKRAEWRKNSQYYEKHKHYWRKWYQDNKETVRAGMDRWRAENLDRWNGYGRKRRALMKGLLSEPYLGMEIFERDEGLCGICGEAIDIMLRFPDVKSFSVDHVIPIARGGHDIKSNLQAAHLGCNARKADRG